MRNSMLSFFFAFVIFLCSCSNALPGDINADEPAAMPEGTYYATASDVNGHRPDTMPEEKQYAAAPNVIRHWPNTVPVETYAEEPYGTELLSVVFMGETITAPDSYPGVPDVYAPIINDLYLHREVTRRYSILPYEDKVAFIGECMRTHNEVRSRGHLPYPGDGSGSGYALVDLDGDGSPELLILQDFAYDMEKPEIKSVFTMRNGRLVCVDNGSSELRRTILADDGAFYQYTDWLGTGYANLSAFRLESGMSKFTVILEARAALSFSGGDVPVPYWAKTENGEDISITEDDFNALLERYKNPKNHMSLDFVPVHPEAVELWSAPYPPDEPPAIPIEYPLAYQDAPRAYKPILDALFLLAERMRMEEYGYDDIGLEAVGFRELPSLYDSSLGYALVDLNNDGTQELLLGYLKNDAEGQEEFTLCSIFILKNGEPVLLESFWSRNRGAVTADGTIYRVGSGGAAYAYLSSFWLEKNADALTQLTDMRSDYSPSEEKPYYVQIVDGKNHYISEEVFSDFFAMYDDPPNKMKVTFIPIAN